MKKIFLAFLVIILSIGITFFIRLYSYDSNTILNSDDSESDDGIFSDIFDENGGDDKDESSTSSSSTTIKGQVSIDSLSLHNKQSDCWVAYDGKVYDITSYLPKHPGSAAKIKPYCGTSEGFINAFEGKHGTSKVSLLMKVGTLMGDLELVGSI